MTDAPKIGLNELRSLMEATPGIDQLGEAHSFSWKRYSELNASYLQGGKFTAKEIAKHQTAG